jgi:hypothetical protein
MRETLRVIYPTRNPPFSFRSICFNCSMLHLPYLGSSRKDSPKEAREVGSNSQRETQPTLLGRPVMVHYVVKMPNVFILLLSHTGFFWLDSQFFMPQFPLVTLYACQFCPKLFILFIHTTAFLAKQPVFYATISLDYVTFLSICSMKCINRHAHPLSIGHNKSDEKGACRGRGRLRPSFFCFEVLKKISLNPWGLSHSFLVQL